jgi:tight adherence protein C
MITGLVLGAGIGAGVLLAVRACRPRRPELAAELARLQPGGSGRLQPGGSGRLKPGGRTRLDAAPIPLDQRIGARAIEVLGSAAGTVDRKDLRVTGRTPERHVAEKLAAATCGLAVPVLVALLVDLSGVAVPIGGALVAGVLCGVAGWLLPDALLRDAARRRRDEFRHALSSFLDLVNVVLAGGAGIETALEAAAEAGDGWAFGELRAVLARARLTRTSPWDAFAQLGDELAVTELSELAASVRLAGEQGARIKASLAAKAASLRGHQLARVEADAQAASERMAVPTVLMFTGFLVFIGYPALAQILGGSGL